MVFFAAVLAFMLAKTAVTAWTPLAERPSRPYVVFINGLLSSSDGDPYNNMGFDSIRRYLADHSTYTFTDEHFILYSYNGGQVVDGLWQPNPYSPGDTTQPLTKSVASLDEMIEQVRQHDPGAAFLLVGHSLGGRIAWDYFVKHAEDHQIGEYIIGAVTLDSPINGCGYKELEELLGDYATEITESITAVGAEGVVEELAEDYLNRSQRMVENRLSAKKLQQRGVVVATFTSKDDLIVPPYCAAITAEDGTLATEGAVLSLGYDLSSPLGHEQVLESERVARYIADLLEYDKR